MKIVFFTPCISTSAIGRMAELVVRELISLGNSITVVRCEEQSQLNRPARAFAAATINWTDSTQVLESAIDADICIYQIGNNFSFHQGCIEWMDRFPGIVCLHDFFLGHLFWAWADSAGRHQALPILEAWYGPKVAATFFEHADADTFMEFAVQNAMATEWIASKALGVITHSSWAISCVRRACIGPIRIEALPYDAPNAIVGGPAHSHATDHLTLLTIGQVNPNKRVRSVIDAISRNQLLKERIHYRIVGAIEDGTKQNLLRAAADVGVNVAIMGEVDDDALAREMNNADVICCLRWPTLEAASASAIEALLYAKPTIVTDAGFYAELPDECVMKICQNTEIESLTAALQDMVSSKNRRLQLGALARNYALKTFSARRYATGLTEMVPHVKQCEILGQASRCVAKTLADWGATSSEAILEPIAMPLSIFS